MNLRSMIEQMILTGFYADEITPKCDIYKVLMLYDIGGVILFDYNGKEKSYNRNVHSAKKLRQLTCGLQNASKSPLFIAVDQEGGNVCRLKADKGFHKAVSAFEIGNSNDPVITRKWSVQIAEDLHNSGINLNFAPVVDIAVNQNNPAIAKLNRSFSVLPEKVTLHAKIFCEVMQEYGILSCLKHFPGQGSASTDTHLQFTDITKSWSKNELIPYKILISENCCNMIMTGHLFNDNIDGKYPATLSYKTVQKLLREKLGWQGVVISDDLQMKAINRNYPLENTIMFAINAGVDILLFSNNHVDDLQSSIHNIVNTTMNLVKQGRIKESRIEESCKRIKNLKNNLI